VSQRRESRLEIELAPDGADWAVFVDPDATRVASMTDSLDAPGLWRAAVRGGQVSKIFDVPPLSHLLRNTDSDTDPADESVLLGEIIAWARITASGGRPEAWSAPSADEVKTWFDPDRLAVRSGQHIVKGELHCHAQTLRLVFPELAHLDESLPEARRAWVEALCLDAQSRWRMVRFGIAGQRIGAGVDLSGAPEALVQPLFVRAFEALVYSVGWVLPALTLVTDPSARSHALDRGPVWAQDVLRRSVRPESGLQPIPID
jgi:hypothetical protein